MRAGCESSSLSCSSSPAAANRRNYHTSAETATSCIPAVVWIHHFSSAQPLWWRSCDATSFRTPQKSRHASQRWMFARTVSASKQPDQRPVIRFPRAWQRSHFRANVWPDETVTCVWSFKALGQVPGNPPRTENGPHKACKTLNPLQLRPCRLHTKKKCTNTCSSDSSLVSKCVCVRGVFMGLVDGGSEQETQSQFLLNFEFEAASSHILSSNLTFPSKLGSFAAGSCE